MLISVTGTIVHPKATIFAIAGPIVIGTGCIIEEGAIIVNRSVVTLICSVINAHLHPRRKEVMRIGDDNLFEIGCRASFPFAMSHAYLNSETIL
jgi:dynactin 6